MLNLKSLLFLIGIKVYEMNPPKTALIYVYGCLGSLNSLRFKSYNQGFLRAGGTRHNKRPHDSGQYIEPPQKD